MVFTGFERFWMQVLVDGLQRHRDEIDASWVLWPSTTAERMRFLGAMARADVMVRVGMPFDFSGTTNRAWLRLMRVLRKIGVNYWIGYDSLAYVRRARRDLATPADLHAIDTLRHFAATENIEGLLRGAGVPATTVVFPSPEREVPEAPPLPDEFRVLLYWSDNDPPYHDVPNIMEAARRLPDVAFDVVGATGAHVIDPPCNVRFHGRQADVEPFYRDTCVLVRLPEWDAVPGGMVEEALAFGRRVIYSFEFPHTIFVARGDLDGLVAELSRLQVEHSSGRLQHNLEGRAYILETWDPVKRWKEVRDGLVRISDR